MPAYRPQMLRPFTLLLAYLLTAVPLAAQKERRPENAPENCSWCEGDPARMQAAGIVNHGGFKFCSTDTAGVDRHFGGKDIYWIESEHLRIGLCLGPHKVGPDEAKKVRADLTELSAKLPKVDPKTKNLDPFMRAHLYAHRLERAYARFMELMRVEASDFPDGRSVWLLGTPYFGEGPYLGQKEKYEVLVLPTGADQASFMLPQFGLAVKRTQRWNIMERDCLVVVTNLAENELRSDGQLYGHLVFNLAVNFQDGFKHYSYETPVWIREGLAHFMEREIDPKYNTFDSSEGGQSIKVNKENWDAEVKQLIAAGKAPRVAELAALKTYAEFELRHHYACWSMTRFLIETNPEGYAKLQGKLHGRKKPDGTPDSEDMMTVLREAFQECLGMGYAQFDAAWQAWAATQ